MAREHNDWSELTRSIHQNRASNALFYKPVCVIAAIDLADAGGLVSDMLYADLIVHKFEQYVSVAYPTRGSKGWWPLWFLANDGLWNFSKRGKLLSKVDLATRPTTKNKTLQRFDRQAIAPEYRDLWNSAADRKTLRDQMLAIMNRYSESKLLVRALFDPALFDQADRWPSQSEVDSYLNDLSGQGDLFQDQAPLEQFNKPRTVTAVRKALSTFDATALPPVSPIGPELEITGSTPIAISTPAFREVTAPQAALYAALRQKSLLLDEMAANSNRATHLRPALADMIRALEGEPNQSSGYLIWSPGNTLRRLLAAELAVLDETDPETPPLTVRMRELLTDLVEQFNVYVTTDGLVALLDAAKAGPARRSQLSLPLDAGGNLAKALDQSPGIVTAEAAKVLRTVTLNAENAKDAPGFDAEQAVVNAVEIQRNTAGGILRNAVVEFKKLTIKVKSGSKTLGEGMAKQLGVEIAKLLPITWFVNSVRDTFTALWHGTPNWDAVKHLIELIQEFFSHFRD
jgi:hypothetical protein